MVVFLKNVEKISADADVSLFFNFYILCSQTGLGQSCGAKVARAGKDLPEARL